MWNLKKLTKIFFFLILISCSESEIPKKNFIIILADDLGYSDLGSFGSEINTPNIDMLAQEGVIMSNFHTHHYVLHLGQCFCQEMIITLLVLVFKHLVPKILGMKVNFLKE